jgi:hypothetical protein
MPSLQSLLVRALVGVAIVAPTASAQSADPRWTPYLGCWAPMEQGQSNAQTIGLARSYGTPREAVCVLPTDAPHVVNVVSVVNGRKVGGEPVNASGTKVERETEGCTGWEKATFSGDGHRVLLRSEFRCPGDIVRKSSGVFATSAKGAWIDVEGLEVNGANGVRVVRLRDIGMTAASLRRLAVAATGDSVSLDGTGLPPAATTTLRAAASTGLDVQSVVEVSRYVDAGVAESWLVAQGEKFTADGRSLVKMADAGVPPGMLDMMVAMAYPKQFAIATSGTNGAEVRAIEPDPALARMRVSNTKPLAAMDQFEIAMMTCSSQARLRSAQARMQIGMYDPCGSAPLFGRSLLSAYGYGYDLLFRDPNALTYGLGINPFYTQRPWVQDPNFIGKGGGSDAGGGGGSGSNTFRPQTQGARAEKGSGYTRDISPPSDRAATAPTRDVSPAPVSSPPASTSGTATEARTAKPKGGGA